MRILAVTICMFCFYFLQAQNDQEVLSLKTESKLYLERKKYKDALVKINDALKLDKENADLYFIRAEINFYLDDYNNALSDYEKAMGKKENYNEALNGKILCMSFMGNTKDALDIANNAINKSPAEPIFYYSRGIVNNEREKYSKAIEDFDKALSLAEQNEFRIFLSRGVAKLNLGEFPGAMEDLNQAIELDPKNASAYHSRGRVFYETRDFDSAIKDFEQSLNMNPRNEVAYYNLGMTYYRMGKMDDACSFFQESCNMEYIHACKMVIVECQKK